MKEIALIWDLDGTLIDSYRAIVPSLQIALARQGVSLSQAEIYRYIIAKSIGEFIPQVEQTYCITFDASYYGFLRREREEKMQPIAHAPQLLERLNRAGVANFIFTHRGPSTPHMLELTGLEGCFREVITGVQGFPRKPAPEALLYLMEKYHLDSRCTFYIGDRPLDMDCAENAGISGIFFHPEGSPISAPSNAAFTIRELSELYDLLELNRQA